MLLLLPPTMAAQLTLMIPLCSLLIAHLFISEVVSTTFTITNKCDYTVWPGILSNADAPPLSTTGFALEKGESRNITGPASWGGRMWGRTYCSQDSTRKLSCVTGDCGGKLECSGTAGASPATLVEFKLGGHGGLDYFDVSLVDGYNLAILVEPLGGSGQNCASTGCVVDLNRACPLELKVTSADGDSVACKSACEAFRQPQYCCSGEYGTAATCKPSSYAQFFKNACPRAYSYAYDDKTSTFTCASADYHITFCPSTNTSGNDDDDDGNDDDENEDDDVSNGDGDGDGDGRIPPSLGATIGNSTVGQRITSGFSIHESIPVDQLQGGESTQKRSRGKGEDKKTGYDSHSPQCDYGDLRGDISNLASIFISRTCM